MWSYGHASLVHQGMGAMIVLVLGGLWEGREHLQQVFRKAFARAPDVDDGDEIRCPTAGAGAVGSTLLRAALPRYLPNLYHASGKPTR